MRRHVICLSPGDLLVAAAEMMQLGRMRQLPVVEDGRLVGELSFLELCAAFLTRLASRTRAAEPRALAALRVGQVMHPAEGWVSPEADLPAVARQIARRGNGFAVVADDGAAHPRLLGVVTERDLLRRALVAARPPV